MANHFRILALRTHEQYEKANTFRTLKDKLLRQLGVQYATGEEWRNNSRKNEEMKPKQKQHPVVDGTGDRNKVQCCKEQYFIGTWNVQFSSVQSLSRVQIFATP